MFFYRESCSKYIDFIKHGNIISTDNSIINNIVLYYRINSAQNVRRQDEK